MLEEAEHRLPCLLDRLVDEAPGDKLGESGARSVSLSAYRMAVLRDLRWLLNSANQPTFSEVHDYPEVRTSVMNYGISDLAGRISSTLDPLKIESDLRDAILNFEPRIIPDSLQVRLIGGTETEGRIAFEINGQLWALPHAERILFRTEMDLETGACELTMV